MPTYTFYDNRIPTNQHTEFMSISEMEAYLKNHPEITLMPSAPSIGDSIRLGITKPPADFQKHVLGRMRDGVKGKNMLKDTKFSVPREI